MNAAVEFPWPKELHAIKRAAEEGTLEPRSLYPIEVRALCNLVADAPLTNIPREIAPGMSAVMRAEDRITSAGTRECRSAFYFIAQLTDGRVWQCSLFCDWQFVPLFEEYAKDRELKPRNIVQALTRVRKPRSAARRPATCNGASAEGGQR